MCLGLPVTYLYMCLGVDVYIYTPKHIQWEKNNTHIINICVCVYSRLPVTATVYAYSWYKVGDMNTSATPTVAFTTILENPLNETLTASFMFNFPHGIEPHTQRAFPQLSDNEWEESGPSHHRERTERCGQCCVVF